MYVLYGALGCLACLLLVAIGVVVGWKIRGVYDRGFQSRAPMTAEEEKAQAARQREAYLEGKTCLRCGTPLIKKGARRFQMYEYESLSDSIFNPSADTLLLDVLCCPVCRKVEFFLPEEAGN